jgi:O-methyltransferase
MGRFPLIEPVRQLISSPSPACGNLNGMNARDLYLDLLKRTLTDLIHDESGTTSLNGVPYQVEARTEGRDWPIRAHTMIGLRRLDNLHACAQRTIDENVPGDFIEAGVWRGGAAIFLKGLLAANAVTDRRVWVADSFAGLPPPDGLLYPADAGDPHHTFETLAVSRSEVMHNFALYGLLDDGVCFVEGWFRDTLPTLPAERFAIVRLDGDMYGSTIEAITTLYPRLSPGGYLVVDDYALKGCAQAINDYREREGITDPIEIVDWTGVFWRKS